MKGGGMRWGEDGADERTGRCPVRVHRASLHSSHSQIEGCEIPRLDEAVAERVLHRVVGKGVGDRRHDHALVECQHGLGHDFGADVDRVEKAVVAVDRKGRDHGLKIGHGLARREPQGEERSVRGHDAVLEAPSGTRLVCAALRVVIAGSCIPRDQCRWHPRHRSCNLPRAGCRREAPVSVMGFIEAMLDLCPHIEWMVDAPTVPRPLGLRDEQRDHQGLEHAAAPARHDSQPPVSVVPLEDRHSFVTAHHALRGLDAAESALLATCGTSGNSARAEAGHGRSRCS